MTHEHVLAVARLHQENLSSPFQGRPGRELLCNYYAALIDSSGAVGFVAIERQEVLGFICGIFNPQDIKISFLKKHPRRMLTWGSLLVISRPGLIVDLSSRLVHPGQNSLSQSPGYELRPIVVAPAARGGGVGRALLQALLEDAASRGFDCIHLITEIDNEAAIRFYQNNNFQRIGQLDRGGQIYFCYEHPLLVNHDT